MQNKVEHVEDTPKESEGLIKTPRQLAVVVFLAFLIPIIAIFLLVKLVIVTSPMGAGSDAQSSEAIAQRIHPVAGFKLVDAASDAPAEARTGQQVYELTCATCHAAGVANAPTFGDNAAWAPLIETGFDQMVKIAIEGVGAMPPRGGNSSLSDTEVARAVAYMANNSGGSFDEPAEDGASAAAGADSATDTASQEAAPAADEAPQVAAQQPEATEEAQQPEGTTEAETATDAAPATEQAAAATETEPAADTAAPDFAEIQPILAKNACLACHAVETKTLGPAYREVAEKYTGDPDAAATLAQHIKSGSSGIWGPIPMPPNPGISDTELTQVVDWILAGAPQ